MEEKELIELMNKADKEMPKHSEYRKKVEESCIQQFGSISANHQNYIDGMVEGYFKGIAEFTDKLQKAVLQNQGQ